MGIGLGWEGNRLTMQRAGNPLICSNNVILRSLAQSLVKKMGTSGWTEKCPQQFNLLLPKMGILYSQLGLLSFGCIVAFAKRVNRGYPHTQYTSTGDEPVIGNIPSLKKALKLSKGGCTTSLEGARIHRPNGVIPICIGKQTSFTPRKFSAMQLGIHNLYIPGKLWIYPPLHIYNTHIPSCTVTHFLCVCVCVWEGGHCGVWTSVLVSSE